MRRSVPEPLMLSNNPHLHPAEMDDERSSPGGIIPTDADYSLGSLVNLDQLLILDSTQLHVLVQFHFLPVPYRTYHRLNVQFTSLEPDCDLKVGKEILGKARQRRAQLGHTQDGMKLRSAFIRAARRQSDERKRRCRLPTHDRAAKLRKNES